MKESFLAVGVPREIKPGEKRVGLTPVGAQRLVEAGILVLVQVGAGEASGFSDKDYQKAGARRVDDARELYRKAGLVKKVKEPVSSEWESLQPGTVLFGFLHLASPENKRLVEILLEKKIIAIALEVVQKGGRTILLEPMSEIAGTLAGYIAGFFKQGFKEEKKVIYPPRFLEKLEWLAAQYPQIPENLPPGRVAIYGGGVVGRKAAETILKMGGEVDLIEKQEARRQTLKSELSRYGRHLRVWGLGDSLEEKLKEADVWIGCVHVAGQRAPLVMSREELGRLSQEKPKLILDIAADQGGNFPETRSTTYQDPLFLDSFGNWRFAVTNVPSLCGQAASKAIEEATLSYTLRLAQDWRRALAESEELKSGVQAYEGRLTNEAVAVAHGLSWERLRL